MHKFFSQYLGPTGTNKHFFLLLPTKQTRQHPIFIRKNCLLTFQGSFFPPNSKLCRTYQAVYENFDSNWLKFESTKNRFNLLLVFFNNFFRIAGAEKMNSDKLIFLKNKQLVSTKKFLHIFFAIFGTNGDQQAFFLLLPTKQTRQHPIFIRKNCLLTFQGSFFPPNSKLCRTYQAVYENFDSNWLKFESTKNRFNLLVAFFASPEPKKWTNFF